MGINIRKQEIKIFRKLVRLIKILILRLVWLDDLCRHGRNYFLSIGWWFNTMHLLRKQTFSYNLIGKWSTQEMQVPPPYWKKCVSAKAGIISLPNKFKNPTGLYKWFIWNLKYEIQIRPFSANLKLQPSCGCAELDYS